MDKNTQITLAESFQKRHRGSRILLLPNAWDAVSARIFESAGFDAVATTSGGIAWALGYPDGEQAPWQEVVAATARITRVLRVPVTADIESGYGERPEDVAARVSDIIKAGAVGINLEDGTARKDMPLRPIDEAAARIRAARSTADVIGIPIVINARIDAYSKHIGDERTCFNETIRRATAYLAAGADCLFPFGIGDIKTIAEVVQAAKAPINVVGRPGTPAMDQLARAGVARVSTASGPALAAIDLTRRIASELRTTGKFDMLACDTKRADVQHLLTHEME